MSRSDVLGIARTPAGLWAILAVQVALLAALTVFDFGWHGRGGTFGLREGHQILGGLLYAALCIGCIGWAIACRAWGVLGVAVLVPAVAFAWSSGRFAPRLDAAGQQNLVGMTEAQAVEALDARGAYWAGSQHDERGSALVYDGFLVFLSDERRITRVVPGPDPESSPASPPLVAAEHQDLVGMPVEAAADSLRRRGGIDAGSATDASGDFIEFNGVRLYAEGVQRVVRVTPEDGS